MENYNNDFLQGKAQGRKELASSMIQALRGFLSMSGQLKEKDGFEQGYLEIRGMIADLISHLHNVKIDP